ncbi:hypothetical protein BJV77DRAFT_1069603 [Russula vinacea]|nr:hypothetical protein BJV77DRAFT_1069603 [Russula vinacea]
MATNNPQTLASFREDMRNDDGNEMWNMCVAEVKEDDKRIADVWKEGSNGILTFTGLFSVILSAFIIEFYKQLSPNSGIQTVIPLANGTYSIIANPPPPPRASMIWVNAMWLISLVLSLASALIAALLQEWARRYVETADLPSKPNHRARVRSFLFLGTETYKMRQIVQMGFSLLHISVFLLFAGLVIVFHTINKKVAIVVDTTVGGLGLAYIVLSILPCLDVQCPYRTPMSNFLWFPTHATLSLLAFFFYLVGTDIQQTRPEAEPGFPNYHTASRRTLVDWMASRETAVIKHLQYIAYGLRKSTINNAINAQGYGDRKIIARLFNLLAQGKENKFRKFAASIPRDRVRQLIPDIDTESGRIVLLNPLATLLRISAARIAGPDEEVRRRSLLVCIEAIHNIARHPGIRVSELEYARANFADIGLMRELWGDSDTAIRVTSRSICALLAKQVVEKDWFFDSGTQLRWLQEVTGSRPGDGYDADTGTRNRMNFKTFVYGVLSHQEGDQEGDLPTEAAASFKETLATLLDVELDADSDTNFQNRLSEEVGRIHQDDPEGSGDVVDKLRTMFHLPIPSPQPSLQTQV